MESGLLDIRQIVWSIDHTSTPCRVCKIPQDHDALILDGICVDCATEPIDDEVWYFDKCERDIISWECGADDND